MPTRSVVFANSACINYLTGDILAGKGAMFCSKSKANVYQKDAACLAYFKKYMRKIIEANISNIKALFLRKVHAVIFRICLRKILLFLLAFQINKAFLN
ncbi:MAG: hypothetical protein ACYC2U_00445 [Candidatus Amoebophilus sp.]